MSSPEPSRYVPPHLGATPCFAVARFPATSSFNTELFATTRSTFGLENCSGKLACDFSPFLSLFAISSYALHIISIALRFSLRSSAYGISSSCLLIHQPPQQDDVLNKRGGPLPPSPTVRRSPHTSTSLHLLTVNWALTEMSSVKYPPSGHSSPHTFASAPSPPRTPPPN